MNGRVEGWDFVCRALAPDTAPQGIDALRRHFTPESPIWPFVVQWADAHLVTPAVWLGLAAKGLAGELPAEPRQYLQAVYDMNRDRNRAILSQLDDALQVLNAEGIVPMLLKGAAHLKAGVYADSGARILSDLDLLVDEAEAERAFNALKRAGYTAEKEGRWTNDRHCAPLARPGSPAAIEIHWRHFRGHLDQILPTAELRANAIGLTAGGRRFRVPCPTHAALASFLHSQVMDGFSDLFIIGLRPVLDTLALDSTYRGAIEWDAIREAVDAHGEGARLRTYLDSVRRVTGRAIAPHIGAGLRGRLHYGLCRMRVRSKLVESITARYTGFAASRLQRKYGPARGAFTLHRYRLRQVAEAIQRRRAAS